MTDRELLELAAKAAGIEWVPASTEKGIELEPVFGLWLKAYSEPYEGQRRRWNPLVDDGDALRLAVELHMNLNVYTTKTTTTADEFFGEVFHQGDKYAATRSAIVRAAAEIGKELK